MKLRKNDNVKGILESAIYEKSTLIKAVDRGYRLCLQAAENWGIEGAFDVIYISAMSNKDSIIFGTNTLCTTTTKKFPEELWNLILSPEDRQSICHYAEICGFNFHNDKTEKPWLVRPRFSYVEETLGWTPHKTLTIRVKSDDSEIENVHRIKLDELGNLNYSYQRSILLNFPWVKDALQKVSTPFKRLDEHLEKLDKTERQLRKLKSQLHSLTETQLNGFEDAIQNRVADIVQKAIGIAAIDWEYESKREKLCELIGSFHVNEQARCSPCFSVSDTEEEDDSPYM